MKLKREVKSKKIRTILESLIKGSSILRACEAADINPATCFKWRARHQVFDKAVVQIMKSRVQLVEDALYKTAMEGNTTAQIFFLVNRAPSSWKHKDSQVRVEQNLQVLNLNAVAEGIKAQLGEERERIGQKIAEALGIGLEVSPSESDE